MPSKLYRTFKQYWNERYNYINNKPINELPVKAIDINKLPMYVILRNGEKCAAVGVTDDGNSISCVSMNCRVHWIVCKDGYYSISKQPHKYDIVNTCRKCTKIKYPEVDFHEPIEL